MCMKPLQGLKFSTAFALNHKSNLDNKKYRYEIDYCLDNQYHASGIYLQAARLVFCYNHDIVCLDNIIKGYTFF